MADIKSPEERSKNMSAIKRADTKPEKYIRKLLFSSGYRYRLQTDSVPGHPDLWLRRYNTAIFIHGCFWHRHKGCRYAYTPKSRIEFWKNKFEKNELRDQIVMEQLRKREVKCLVIWECTIKNVQKKNGNPAQLLEDIEAFIASDQQYREL
jgi:DNA mismatch endonuclease (patch repair protein)